jgi:cytochrome c556
METILISIFFTLLISGMIVIKKITNKNREKMMKEIEETHSK